MASLMLLAGCQARSDDVRGPGGGATPGAGAVTAGLPPGWVSARSAPFSCKGDGIADDTACLQAALDASYGGRLLLPRGDYRFRGPLRIEPLRSGRSALPIIVQGDGFDANGGSGGTILRNTGSGPGFEIVNGSQHNADNLIVLERFALVGDGQDEPGGSGIVAVRANNLNLRDLWVQDQRESGVYLEDCWGSNLDNVTILRSRRHGLHLHQRFNMGTVRRLRAYANGRVYDGVHANVFVSGRAGLEHLGARFEQVDVSYAGAAPFRAFGRAPASGGKGPIRLLAVTVHGGMATVTTEAPHGMARGNLVSLSGAPDDSGLSSRVPYTVEAVIGPRKFTLAAPGARPASYDDRSLRIRPFAVGMWLDWMRGVVVHNGYAEDCAGPSLVLRNVSGFEIAGGYFQNQFTVVDGATHGRIGGAVFNGPGAGLEVKTEGRSEVDVGGDNVFADGARLVTGAVWKRDGRYLAAAAPTGGAWIGGDQVWNAAPKPGAPVAWVYLAGEGLGSWSTLASIGDR